MPLAKSLPVGEGVEERFEALRDMMVLITAYRLQGTNSKACRHPSRISTIIIILFTVIIMTIFTAAVIECVLVMKNCSSYCHCCYHH